MRRAIASPLSAALVFLLSGCGCELDARYL